MLRITVCGNSSVARSIAAICAWRGSRVRVFDATRLSWTNSIKGSLPDGTSFIGPLELVTSDPCKAVQNSDIVILCVRHRELAAVLKVIAPYLSEETLVGAVPGFGGFGMLCRRILPSQRCFFATQRIPFVIDAYHAGEDVSISGLRRQTFVGTMPAGRSPEVSELLQELFGVRTVPVSHFINIELSPSNSLVNPARLYSLFGSTCALQRSNQKEFFLDWDIHASEILLLMDRELQFGKLRIPRDTSFVAPILLQYDANDIVTLTDRFRSLHTLRGRSIPIREDEGRFMLDFRSDYVREDIDFGLALIRDILRLAGAETTVMDRIIKWRATHGPMSQAWRKHLDQVPTRFHENIESMMSALD